MALACSLPGLCTRPQRQSVLRHLPVRRAAAQPHWTISQLLLRPRNLTSHLVDGIRRSKYMIRKGSMPTMIRAIASTGPLVQEESWGPEDDVRLNPQERPAVKQKKRRVIAGVDQTTLLDPHLLTDPDSRFAEFFGVQIHHKIARPSPIRYSSSEKKAEEDESAVPVAILLHGFGASLFSWERVMPRLSEILGSAVLAFDRPAFGFTSRPFPSRSPERKAKQKFGSVYSVGFSAAAVLAFVDFLESDQAILIGHSAGSLAAVEAYFQCPEKIVAMVLVAPALVAPLVLKQIEDTKQSKIKESALMEAVKKGRIDIFGKARAALMWIWIKFSTFARMVWRSVLLALGELVGFLFRSPPAIWLVRRIMDKGGPWAVRYAFYDVLKADKYVLDGYTKPLKCRDWERALLEYCLALIDNTKEQVSGKRKLQNITCPVLVVAGDTDRIVPNWNSERLVKCFPKGEFKRIKNCGHLPQEETPEQFLEIIENWLLHTLKNGSTLRAQL